MLKKQKKKMTYIGDIINLDVPNIVYGFCSLTLSETNKHTNSI